jgi:hypothetical protein
VDHRLHHRLHPLTPSEPSRPREGREPRNPFRDERDTFRLLIIVAVAAAIVIAVALLIDTLPAALLGLVFVAIGAWRAWGWLRYWLGTRTESES